MDTVWALIGSVWVDMILFSFVWVDVIMFGSVWVGAVITLTVFTVKWMKNCA